MWIWRTIGGLFFCLGGIGIVLPGWPTTIFWIIAAICFARSDPRWADWIYARPGVGPQIKTFVESGAMSRTAKVSALVGMALAAIIIVLTLRQYHWPLSLGLGLILIGAIYVITRKLPLD